jgi:membrane protein YdbS with pleckstrin-like domain
VSDYQRLDPRYVTLQRLIGRLVALALSVPLFVASIVLLTPRRWLWAVLLWLAVLAVMIWFFSWWPERDYEHRAYRADADGIEIKAGVYWRRVMNVPRSRVQHTDVAQGPLERRFGLGRLVVYTAGTDHSRVELPWLDHGAALSLRDHLLPQSTSDAV